MDIQTLTHCPNWPQEQSVQQQRQSLIVTAVVVPSHHILTTSTKYSDQLAPISVFQSNPFRSWILSCLICSRELVNVRFKWWRLSTDLPWARLKSRQQENYYSEMKYSRNARTSIRRHWWDIRNQLKLNNNSLSDQCIWISKIKFYTVNNLMVYISQLLFSTIVS